MVTTENNILFDYRKNEKRKHNFPIKTMSKDKFTGTQKCEERAFSVPLNLRRSETSPTRKIKFSIAIFSILKKIQFSDDRIKKETKK